MSLQEQFDYEGPPKGRRDPMTEEEKRDLQWRMEMERVKLQKLAFALRNMAQALENQIFAIHPDSIYANADGSNVGQLEANDEMGVHASINHGKAWQGEPNSYGVFEAWVHFSVGPNAVWTDNLDAPYEKWESYRNTHRLSEEVERLKFYDWGERLLQPVPGDE
jgi:hypothetical protein